MNEERERMNADASGVLGPKPDGPPWLNSVEVVEGILRTFASEAIRRLGTPEGVQWVLDRGKQLNATFMGRGYADGDPIYATGPWNTPEFIGSNCIHALQISGEDRHGPMLAILLMAADLVGVIEANAGEEPEAYAPEMDRIIERTRNALLGLPMVRP